MEALTVVFSVIAIGVSAMALAASIYSMWFSRCRETDLEELREAYEEVSNQLSEVEKNICDKLDAMNKQYSCDLIEIKNSTSAVQRQVEIINLRYKDSPNPQEHMRLHISQLYSKIAELEDQKLQLEARCADLQEHLQDANQKTA